MTIEELIDEIELYYRSGNSVPVERASIPREKWESLKAEIEALQDDLREAEIDRDWHEERLNSILEGMD